MEIDAAIKCFRPILRNYLSVKDNKFASLKGIELHIDLLQFISISTRKRLKKIQSEILGEAVGTETDPVYITKDQLPTQTFQR